MNHFWRTAVCVLALSTALAPTLSEAKRLGGGGSSGMQRSAPSQNTPAQNTPAQTPQSPQQGATAAAPMAGAAATGAAAAAGKRSWMGPIAGLAAGLGIAALMSHLGLGEAFGNFLMIALLIMAALAAFAWFKRRSNGAGQRPALAGAGAAAGSGSGGLFGTAAPQPESTLQRSAHSVSWPAAGAPGSAAASFGPEGSPQAAASLPADFDRAGFERIARMIFIRMQAANDRGDLNDLREFTTPELFASIRTDLQDRGGKAQVTDVVDVRAEIIDFDREAQRDVVSVRYTGLIREEAGAEAAPFDEIWHLVQPSDRSRNWAIAGIQQAS